MLKLFLFFKNSNFVYEIRIRVQIRFVAHADVVANYTAVGV